MLINTDIKMKDLQRLRKQIDHIDEQILNLLNNRAELAIEVGKYKTQNNAQPGVYAPRARSTNFKAHRRTSRAK